MPNNAFGGDRYGGEPYAGQRVTGTNPFHNSFPTLYVEIGFGNNALDEPVTWTDVTQYVRSVKTNRGRQHELNRFEAGTATLVLSNRDGRFSPFNTSGAYYPNVKPFVPIRVRARWDGATYPVYRGYVEAWPLKWADAANSDVTVNAVDATKVLNLKKAASLVSYSTTVLNDSPNQFWVLSDAPNTTTPANSVAGGAALTLSTAAPAISGLTSTFGNSPPLPASTATSWSSGSQAGTLATFSTISSFSSLEFWFNSSGLNQQNTHLFKYNDASSSGYDIYIGTTTTSGAGTGNTGCLSVYIYGSGAGSCQCLGLVPIADGKWHHCVVTDDSSGATGVVKIYIDGVLDNTNTFPVGKVVGFLTSVFAIGGNAFWNITAWTITTAAAAQFANVALYSAVLTPTQVTNHYVAGMLPRQGELTGARVGAFLDAVTWPSTLRKIDAGLLAVQPADATAVTNTSLANIQIASDTEGGDVFIAADGSVVFFDHTHKYVTPNGLPAAVLGDSGTTGPGGESPYQLDSVDIQYDDLDLYNQAVVTPAGQGAQIANDTASQTTYGIRTTSRQGIQLNSNDALNEAGWLVGKYKTPLQRVRSVTFTPYSDAAVLYPAALGFELLTRVTLKRRPKDGASSTFSQDSLIEGIEHDVTPGLWQTTWRLSPTDASPVMWIIDDPVAGKIVDGATQSPPVGIGY